MRSVRYTVADPTDESALRTSAIKSSAVKCSPISNNRSRISRRWLVERNPRRPMTDSSSALSRFRSLNSVTIALLRRRCSCLGSAVPSDAFSDARVELPVSRRPVSGICLRGVAFRPGDRRDAAHLAAARERPMTLQHISGQLDDVILCPGENCDHGPIWPNGSGADTGTGAGTGGRCEGPDASGAQCFWRPMLLAPMLLARWLCPTLLARRFWPDGSRRPSPSGLTSSASVLLVSRGRRRPTFSRGAPRQIGRASCRERV